MTTFPGTVTLDPNNDVPVTVGLEDDRISLVAGEVSIAEYGAGEYVVVDLGEGTFIIEAEEGSISFHPDDPGGFAQGIGYGPEVVSATRPRSTASDTVDIKLGPPPRPATLTAFYTLAVVTAALGIWAFISLL
jgi:hypothetical protein